MCVINGGGFLRDMRTAMDYVRAAEPIIVKLLNGGRFMPVEGSDDEVCRMLDTTCGTDYFQVYDHSGLVWGVASRMQEINASLHRPFNTFTVRKARESGVKTEYEKRRYAIEHNGVYPFLTMQGYVDIQTGELLSLGIARTVDIMSCIDAGKAIVRHTGTEQIGQAEFYVLPWDRMRAMGKHVKVWNAGE